MKLNIVRTSAWIAALAFSFIPNISAQTQAKRLRGIVASFNGQVLAVKTAGGPIVSVTIPVELVIHADAKATLSDIKPGDFVGATADKGHDGRLHAEEIHIFSEDMRGTNEGHRPMGFDPNRTTTNGSAASDPEARTMTDGTISAATGSVSGKRTLTIKYKEGEQVIEVAPDVPVVAIIPGDRKLLKPGATVSLLLIPTDGALIATSVEAEKDGVKPR